MVHEIHEDNLVGLANYIAEQKLVNGKAGNLEQLANSEAGLLNKFLKMPHRDRYSMVPREIRSEVWLHAEGCFDDWEEEKNNEYCEHIEATWPKDMSEDEKMAKMEETEVPSPLVGLTSEDRVGAAVAYCIEDMIFTPWIENPHLAEMICNYCDVTYAEQILMEGLSDREVMELAASPQSRNVAIATQYINHLLTHFAFIEWEVDQVTDAAKEE